MSNVCRGGCRGEVSRTGLSASRRPEIDRHRMDRGSVRNHRRRRTAFAFLSVLIIASSGIAFATSYGNLEKTASRISAVTVIPGFPLAHQHSDNTIGLPCNMCNMWMPWHFVVPVLWDDVKYGGAPPGTPPGDNLYGAVGSFDDCPHCSVYSGPASIQMFIMYRGGTAPPQDMIYDICELDLLAGEIAGNAIIERHGVGVTDGTGGTQLEIQFAFQMLVSPYHQHNQSDTSALTASQLLSYMAGLYPVLWDDNGGWPANMDPTFPTADAKNQGHYKVIAGYDDANTGDFSDDWALIYDPWPEYTDHSVLPAGAIPGPSGSFDPYWIPVPMVLGDPNDLFLVELAAIPEFSGLLIPVAGLSLLAVVAVRTRTRRNGP